MAQTVTIEAAQSADIHQLLKLYKTLHPKENELTHEEAIKILERFKLYPGSVVLVARLGTNLVSTASMVIIPNLTRNGAPYALIENVVTDAEYRGRGIAGALLKHAIALAWEHDCYKVMLMTGTKRASILRFYSNLGFEQSKTGYQIRRIESRKE
mgnify:FL=1